MGIITQVIGAGFVSSLLFFPLAYFAFKKQLDLKFSRVKILILFAICIPINGIAYVLTNHPGSATDVADVLNTLFMPLLLCAIVIAVAQAVLKRKSYNKP